MITITVIGTRSDAGQGSIDPEGILREHSAWSRVGYLLWHATLAWQRKVAEVLAPLDLTHVQFVLLASVWWLERNAEAPSQRELADHSGTDPMMTSKVVRTLAAKGYLSRRRDPNDGRVIRLQTTEDGRGKAESALVAIDQVDRWLVTQVGERDELLRTLRAIAGRDADGVATR